MPALYDEFLESKHFRQVAYGKQADEAAVHSMLFPFQRDVTVWAVRKGRCAVFLDTGLGKTLIQLEWARLLGEKTLIIAPLSVARQTVREGRKIGLDVHYVRSQEQIDGADNLWITNYEMADAFDMSQFGAVVLDESSILKSIGGKTRRKLTRACQDVPYRLCCTATPAPNDYVELGNHAEFLGVSSRAEMLAMFFINANKEHTYYIDGKAYRKKGTNKAGTEWRLKHHAEQPFFRWLASWAIVMTKPSDLGYDDDGFVLPPLNIESHFVDADYRPDDQLFFTHIRGVRQYAEIRKETAPARLNKLLEIIQQENKDNGIQQGISKTVLPGTQRGKTSICQEAQSGDDRQGEKAEGRLHAPVSGRKPREMGKDQGRAQEDECEAQGVVRQGQMEKRTGADTSKGVGRESSQKAQGAKTERIQSHTKAIQSDARSPRRQVRNMRVLRQERLEHVPSSGSLPRNGKGKGTPVHELQSGSREIPGQSQAAEKSNQLSEDQWVIWCGLNEEQDAVEEAFGDECVSVYGSLSVDEKERRLDLWLDGKKRILISKPRVLGYGLNLQNAHHMAFFGLSHSWEQYYQCIRREWRYLQEHPVDVRIILSNVEDSIYHNVMRKEAQARRLREEMVKQLEQFEREELGMVSPLSDEYQERTVRHDRWTAMLGDAVERMKELGDESIDLSIYSPPFADLYTYTSSARDLGNSRNWDEFFEHYAFVIQEVLRVTKEGRVTCVHTSDIPALKQNDGYIGLKDFPGRVIEAYEREGWIFYGRAVISKNPQALRNSTKVLTPTGWASIETLVPGNEVIGSDGKPTCVTGVYPHEARPMYRVTFNDGAMIECDANHLWTVQTSGRRSYNDSWVTLRTDELYENGPRMPSGAYRYDVPLVKPVKFAQGDSVLPLDPYVVGVLIGDGCLTTRSSVSMCIEHEILDHLNVPNGTIIKKQNGTDKGNGTVATYHITHEEWHENPVLDALRELGLKNVPAWDKRIPELYLRASMDARKELLSGLMDTDGTIKKSGSMWYSTTSAKLAQDVRELVESLGGIATIRTEEPTYQWQGEARTGRMRYQLCIQLDMDWCPFKLERKAARWHKRKYRVRRKIQRIEVIGKSPCTCITVKNEDGLFVTEDYVVTHNSQAIRTHSKGLLFVQLEKDSVWSRPALLDQILIFRKPGDNAVPIKPVQNGEMDRDTWIEWACGIWTDINETEVLQHGHNHGRASDDEKHICPLQLETIERCVKLYSNPGEVVLSPFAGIGSEGYVAVKNNRRAILIELKGSYFEELLKNMHAAEAESDMPTLFEHAGVVVPWQ